MAAKKVACMTNLFYASRMRFHVCLFSNQPTVFNSFVNKYKTLS